MIYLSKADGKSDEVSAFSSTTEVDAEKNILKIMKQHKMSPGSQMNWKKSYLQTRHMVNFVHPFQKG